MRNLNTMMQTAWEPIENHLLVLELGGGIWIPGLPNAHDVVHQVWRHTLRLSMDRQLVDAELEDKAWAGHGIAPETCHLPWFPTASTTIRVRSSGGGLQVAR